MTMTSTSEIIRLNYGGTLFYTKRGTLEQVPFFKSLLRSTENTDEAGSYFVDGTGKYFEPILTFLRRGCLFLDRNINPQGVWEEAMFLNILDMPCGQSSLDGGGGSQTLEDRLLYLLKRFQHPDTELKLTALSKMDTIPSRKRERERERGTI